MLLTRLACYSLLILPFTRCLGANGRKSDASYERSSNVPRRLVTLSPIGSCRAWQKDAPPRGRRNSLPHGAESLQQDHVGRRAQKCDCEARSIVGPREVANLSPVRESRELIWFSAIDRLNPDVRPSVVNVRDSFTIRKQSPRRSCRLHWNPVRTRR